MSTDDVSPTCCPPQPAISIFRGEGSFLDPSASIRCAYYQQQGLESSENVALTAVNLSIGTGTVFHPHSELLILVPHSYKIDVLKIEIGNYNMFEEQCSIEIDLSHYFFTEPTESTNEALAVIGHYNTFGPKCSIRGVTSIGSDNVFDSKCCILSGADRGSDSSDLPVIRMARIEDGCIFAPMVRLKLTGHSDPSRGDAAEDALTAKTPTWHHQVVFLLDGTMQIRSYARLEGNVAATGSRRKEMESLCESMTSLLQQSSKS